MPFIHAQTPAMKEARKRGRNSSKENTSLVLKHGSSIKILKAHSLGFSDDDLLPMADKGKKFDQSTAKNAYKNPETIVVSSELKELLEKTQKRELLAEDEAFMVQGRNITQNPLPAAGIASLDLLIKPEEENLQVCEEHGTFQASFTQTLSVTVTPEIKQQTKQCSGHKKNKKFFWKSKAEEEVKTTEKSLKKDQKISSYHVGIASGGIFKHYAVVATWNHNNNTDSCDSFTTKESVIQAAREEDAWQCSNPEGSSSH